VGVRVGIALSIVEQCPIVKWGLKFFFFWGWGEVAPRASPFFQTWGFSLGVDGVLILLF
jgi:hypothetical protein